MENEELTPAYIARCKCGCGAIVMATVDRPEYQKDVAKDVADAIRDGYTVEHVTVGYVHQAGFGCQHKKVGAVQQEKLL